MRNVNILRLGSIFPFVLGSGRDVTYGPNGRLSIALFLILGNCAMKRSCLYWFGALNEISCDIKLCIGLYWKVLVTYE